MLSKILSILKKEKQQPPHIIQGGQDFLEDVCAEFVIQVNKEGDFVISFDGRDNDIESVVSIGNLAFLINSGTLSSFFIKALRLWTEEVEGQEKYDRENFIGLILLQWEESQQNHQDLLDNSEKSRQGSNESAIDPSRVFNLRKYL